MAALGVLGFLPAAALLADFSYEQTNTITGGAMAAMMKMAGVFSKAAREPMKSTVIVKGDRMAHVSAQHISIIDVGKETITNIDPQKKQYSVITFAEMKQLMERMAEKMKTNDAQMDFKVSANATGASKSINGMDAKEVVIKMEMETTDPKSGQKGSMVITTDSWLAAGIAGYNEVRELQKRMAEKINWAPGGGMMMNRPDMAKGMAAAMKEMAKMDGVPVLQIVKMGGPGGPGQPGTTPEQQAQKPQQQAQAERPSAGSALGGALGGRLGRLGGLGRKPKEQPPAEQPAAQPAAGAAPAAGGAPAGDPASLLEMTMELTSFSAGPVDSGKLEVPAGFKQVDNELKKMK